MMNKKTIKLKDPDYTKLDLEMDQIIEDMKEYEIYTKESQEISSESLNTIYNV